MKSSALLLLPLFLVVNIFAQTPNWDTLKTDDGSFFVNLPSGCYSHFYDKNGISVRNKNDGSRYHLKEMHLVSCYSDKTLMSVEIYETAQSRTSASTETIMRHFGVQKGTSIGSTIYGVEKKITNEKFTLVQRLAMNQKHIYVITAATRGEPNHTMTTFLASLKFPSRVDPGDPSNNAVVISSVKPFIPELIYEKGATQNAAALTDPDQGTELKKLILLNIPKPSYTSAARRTKITGNISLRLNFSAQGRIDQIRVMRDLPDGLLREAVIAAVRIKFLPEEQNGQPRAKSNLVEYNFKTY
jgi:hypothetical protein